MIDRYNSEDVEDLKETLVQLSLQPWGPLVVATLLSPVVYFSLGLYAMAYKLACAIHKG